MRRTHPAPTAIANNDSKATDEIDMAGSDRHAAQRSEDHQRHDAGLEQFEVVSGRRRRARPHRSEPLMTSDSVTKAHTVEKPLSQASETAGNKPPGRRHRRPATRIFQILSVIA